MRRYYFEFDEDVAEASGMPKIGHVDRDEGSLHFVTLPMKITLYATSVYYVEGGCKVYYKNRTTGLASEEIKSKDHAWLVLQSVPL